MLSPYPPRYTTHGLLLQLSQQCSALSGGSDDGDPFRGLVAAAKALCWAARFSRDDILLYWTEVCPVPCPQELRVQRPINVVSEHDLSPSPCQCGLKTAGNSNRRINKVITNRELSDDIYCTTFDRSDVNSVWIRSIVSHWRYCRTSRSLRANREIQIER